MSVSWSYKIHSKLKSSVQSNMRGHRQTFFSIAILQCFHTCSETNNPEFQPTISAVGTEIQGQVYLQVRSPVSVYSDSFSPGLISVALIKIALEV